MTTITTHVPSTPRSGRAAALTLMLVAAAVAVLAATWFVMARESAPDGTPAATAVRSSDDVRAEFDGWMRDRLAATRYSPTIKSPDVVRAEFEEFLREQRTAPTIKSSDQVRAEFESELRVKRAATREPAEVKSPDEERAEFEQWLRASLAVAGE